MSDAMSEAIWQRVEAERLADADLADRLTDEQWGSPSLCTEWTCGEVFAHLVRVPKTAEVLVRVLKAGFRIDRAIGNMAKDAARAGRAAVVAGIRANATQRSAPPGIKPEGVLMDVVMHRYDVAVPLGLDVATGADVMRTALDAVKGQKSGVLPAAKRVAGLSLRATDLDWSSGAGPEVRGPGWALLLAMGGRARGLDALDGDGKATLAGRM